MEIKINLPKIADRGVCVFKGHDWTPWTNVNRMDTEKVQNMIRVCRRCGSKDHMQMEIG